jgi:two-component system, NtrC family, sensor kinase
MLFKKKKENQHSWPQIFSEYNKSLALISDIKQLNQNFKARIKELVAVEKVLVLLGEPDHGQFQPYITNSVNSTDIPSITFNYHDKLIFWLEVNRTHLLVDSAREVLSFLDDHERELIYKNQIHYIYPFIVMNKVKGLVLLGKKTDGSSFTIDETEVLNTFLGQSAFAFENALLNHQQRERVRKMYRADRLATLGELAAGAAHEIRNPLTSIRSTIQYLAKKTGDKDDKEMVSDLLGEVDRINEIINGMLSFSRNEKVHHEEVNLKEILSQVLKLVNNAAKKKKIDLQVNYASDDEIIYVDQSQLKQVIINVLMNAIQAITKESGSIQVSVVLSRGSSEIGNENPLPYYLIEVEDNGKGIDDKEIERLFDPFYTTKPEGTGLGLSISYGIIQKHGGDVEIKSTVGVGTKVIIKLPKKPVHKK